MRCLFFFKSRIWWRNELEGIFVAITRTKTHIVVETAVLLVNRVLKMLVAQSVSFASLRLVMLILPFHL